jgi:hypothetical protein
MPYRPKSSPQVDNLDRKIAPRDPSRGIGDIKTAVTSGGKADIVIDHDQGRSLESIRQLQS